MTDPTTPQPPPGWQQPPPQIVYVQQVAPKNGLGTSAMVLGIIGALIALIPILGFFGIVLGVLAFVFGLIGWSRKRSGSATNGGMAITGAILGAVAIALGVWGLFIVDDALEELEQDLEDIGSISAPR